VFVIGAVDAQNCAFKGGTCTSCLKVGGCAYCQRTGKCFPSNQAYSKCPSRLDQRQASGDNDATCANKCTSESCPVPNSECQPATGKCRCRDGFHAEGEYNHATLCVRQVPESEHKDVVGKCADTDPKFCTARYLSDPQFGCASATGHLIMKDKCRAACGQYCAAHGCKGNGDDYTKFYCRPAGEGNCQDTTAIVYACPRHSVGQVVPKTCNNPRDNRDDNCPKVFTGWFQRCASKLALGGAVKAELQRFNQMCQASLQHKTVIPAPAPVGGCTYKAASNFNSRATVDDRSCRFTGGCHCPAPPPPCPACTSIACQTCANHGGKCKAGKGRHRRLEREGKRQLQSQEVTCFCPKGYDSRTLCATKTSDQHGCGGGSSQVRIHQIHCRKSYISCGVHAGYPRTCVLCLYLVSSELLQPRYGCICSGRQACIGVA
jgi:hypothetical protein